MAEVLETTDKLGALEVTDRLVEEAKRGSLPHLAQLSELINGHITNSAALDALTAQFSLPIPQSAPRARTKAKLESSLAAARRVRLALQGIGNLDALGGTAALQEIIGTHWKSIQSWIGYLLSIMDTMPIEDQLLTSTALSSAFSALVKDVKARQAPVPDGLDLASMGLCLKTFHQDTQHSKPQAAQIRDAEAAASSAFLQLMEYSDPGKPGFQIHGQAPRNILLITAIRLDMTRKRIYDNVDINHALTYVHLIRATIHHSKLRDEPGQVLNTVLSALVRYLNRAGKFSITNGTFNPNLAQGIQSVVGLLPEILANIALVEEASKAGVCQAIAQCCTWIDDMDETHRAAAGDILDIVARYTYWYSIWKVTFETIKKIPKGSRERASRSSIGEQWSQLVELVEGRDVRELMADRDRSYVMTLCDNDECSRVGHRETFTKCRGCWWATYCNEDCQIVDWNIGHHKKVCESKATFKQAKMALGYTVDPVPHSAAVRAPENYRTTLQPRDVIAARPYLRAVAAASTLPSTDLVVCIDYTFSSPNISLQPLKNLDSRSHPFAGGRKAIDEERLRRHAGRFTAVLIKAENSSGRYMVWGYLVHYLLGEDVRSSRVEGTGFLYQPLIQEMLMSQPRDEVASIGVGDALRKLRGAGRKPRVTGTRAAGSSGKNGNVEIVFQAVMP